MTDHLGKLEDTIKRRVNGIVKDVAEDLAERFDLRDEDEDDDADDDDEDGETVSEATGIDESLLEPFYWFIGKTCLEEAAGAYRELGTRDDRVWHHKKAQLAFFGEPEDFEEWCEERRIDPDDCICYKTVNQIFDLDYDTSTIRGVIAEAEEGATEESKADYSRFRWGKEAYGVGVITIEGVNKPLASMGHLTGLQWLSDRAGTLRLHDYDHDDHEDESIPLAMLLQLDRKTFLIHLMGQTVNEFIAAANKERVDKEDFAKYSYNRDVPEIDGISANLTPIGYATGIQYFSDKNDGPHHYDHEHAETTDTFPTVYKFDNHTLLVHGSEMDIREEGICD